MKTSFKVIGTSVVMLFTIGIVSGFATKSWAPNCGGGACTNKSTKQLAQPQKPHHKHRHHQKMA